MTCRYRQKLARERFGTELGRPTLELLRVARPTRPGPFILGWTFVSAQPCLSLC
jgi:hypothetical protein